MDLDQLYWWIKNEFLKSELCDAQSAARILSCYYCGVPVNEFTLNRQKLIKANMPLIRRGVELIVKENYPIQYLVHHQNFYGFDFYVDERVLIPRSDTELLIECVENDFKKNKESLNVFDIGCGSGAIALTIAKIYPRWRIYASDIENEAIEVAKINRNVLNVANVEFLKGDMLVPFKERKLFCDIMLSNPPYIAKTTPLMDRVVRYEPHSALFAPDYGLAHYATMLNNCRHVCTKHARIYFEIGFDQKEALSAMVQSHLPDSAYRFYKDLNNNDRVMAIEL